MFTSGAQTPRADLSSSLQAGYESPKVVADRLRGKGVRVIAVGCCNADVVELREIAGDDRFTLMAGSIGDLQRRVGEINRLVTTG